VIKGQREERKMKNTILRIMGTAVVIGLMICLVQIVSGPMTGCNSAMAILGFGEEKVETTNDMISSIQPKDKLVTQDEEVIVQMGEEKYTVKLKDYGKNSIVIDLKLGDKDPVKVLKRVLRIPSFKDVQDGYWAKKEIELAVASGLILKAKSSYFRPESAMSKDNFVRTLAKAMSINPSALKRAPMPNTSIIW
jgi:hypothetical protein